MNVLLGRGWKFPLRFDARTKQLLMVSDQEDIEESLRILMTTHPGERVMLPAFGCNIRRSVFETLNENTLSELKESIRKAILFFEPRIALNRIETHLLDSMEGRLDIVLDYRIRTTNTRHNLVFPLYLKQASDALGIA